MHRRVQVAAGIVHEGRDHQVAGFLHLRDAVGHGARGGELLHLIQRAAHRLLVRVHQECIPGYKGEHRGTLGRGESQVIARTVFVDPALHTPHVGAVRQLAFQHRDKGIAVNRSLKAQIFRARAVPFRGLFPEKVIVVFVGVVGAGLTGAFDCRD